MSLFLVLSTVIPGLHYTQIKSIFYKYGEIVYLAKPCILIEISTKGS